MSFLGQYEKGLQNGLGIQDDEDLPGYEFKGYFVNNKKEGYGYYRKGGKMVLEGYFKGD